LQFFETIKHFFSGSYHLFRILFSALTGIFIFCFVAFIVIYYGFARDLPDIKTIEDYRPPVISEVFAHDQTKIGEFWTECRFFVPYEKIPRRILLAFLDSEDDRFFEHSGIDMRAILRAFIANLRAKGITQGGSTITQQVTRSLLLSRERSYKRKIKEAILAVRLERSLTKEQILTLYLNQIYLGNRAYGVAAAARNYFHKSLDELTLAEISLIAGLPTAPTSYSPVNNPAAARKRQLHVLGRMLENNHISEEQMQQAMNEPIALFVAGVDKTFTHPSAAYFVEHVRRVVKEQYGDEALYHRGLKIYTTADVSFQEIATKAVRQGVRDLEKRQGYRGPHEHVEKELIPERIQKIETALRREQFDHIIHWPPTTLPREENVLLEEEKQYEAVVTGFEGKNVLIQIGLTKGVIPHRGYKWARSFNTKTVGYDDVNYVSEPRYILKIGDVIFVMKQADGSFYLVQPSETQGALFAVAPDTGFVRALVGGTDFEKSEFNRATQSLRQPGSAFKPFVYAAALDKGYTFDTIIDDDPVEYQVGIDMFWSPKNYGDEYNGPMSFRQALIQSRNIPTVKLAYDMGTDYLTAYVRKFGITTPIDRYLSMALGANGVYLSEIVPAYATFASHGAYRPPVYITRIEDAKGEILYEHQSHLLQTSLPRTPASESETDENVSDEKIAETKEQYTEKVKAAITQVQDSDLNTLLFFQEQQTIEKEDLVLTNLELKTLYGNAIPQGHVITPQTAALMIELLKGVVQSGTGQRVSKLGRPVAGKTGTTNDESDAWFVGFIPDLAVGTWVGFDALKPIGEKETGGKTAAPIFLSFMEAVTKDTEPKDFTLPENFPHGNISALPGGSALFGSRPRMHLPGERGGSDRADEFFEEDLEEQNDVTGVNPPPSSEATNPL